MARRHVIDPRVRTEVIETYGNTCWLGLPGCTQVGAEDDHIVPYSHGGRDTVANIRRACKHCNSSRQDRVLYGYGARLHVVLVPPCCESDALEYIEARRSQDDPVVCASRLAESMGVERRSSAVGKAVGMAWSGAYRQFATCGAPIDVWLVRVMPSSRRHPRMLDEWLALDYDVRVVDPGFAEAFGRAANIEERKLVRQWYGLHLSQALIDARQQARRARLAALGLRAVADESPSRPVW
ncbi:HNH endonuclease [Bifidobacterium cebidarum]|uniref:HNH endonuclease n=1 Tax=Bifidobacterium cebidarum TaxID=2650773 RepID=A0A6I1GFK0_9BIFI|nr:HNH endonuclease [Bifidobacterium cebidarum]KAB7789452.1 HNH endonuclease [Bifidobacterium cebidarum]